MTPIELVVVVDGVRLHRKDLHTSKLTPEKKSTMVKEKKKSGEEKASTTRSPKKRGHDTTGLRVLEDALLHNEVN